jgi:hypothetical protein
MSLVLDLEAGRRTPLRLLLGFGVLALVLLWLTPLPPALLFWFGALGSAVLALFQFCVAALYRRLLPACQARMTRDTRGARGLTAYLRRRLALAYGTLGEDTRLVAVLAALNVAAAAVILFDALLIPTFLWAPLAVFAFASALFALCIAAVSSRIIWDMFGLLTRTS